MAFNNPWAGVTPIPVPTPSVVRSSPGYNSASTQSAPISIDALRFTGGVEFGSRALGVHTDNSDYDFAISLATYEQMDTTSHKRLPIGNYFKVSPKTGNNFLVKALSDRGSLDLLVLEHPSDVDKIRNAVKYMINSFSSIDLAIKNYRINKFEKALLREGFILNWRFRAIKWFANLTNTPTGLWLP